MGPNGFSSQICRTIASWQNTFQYPALSGCVCRRRTPTQVLIAKLNMEAEETNFHIIFSAAPIWRKNHAASRRRHRGWMWWTRARVCVRRERAMREKERVSERENAFFEWRLSKHDYPETQSNRAWNGVSPGTQLYTLISSPKLNFHRWCLRCLPLLPHSLIIKYKKRVVSWQTKRKNKRCVFFTLGNDF